MIKMNILNFKIKMFKKLFQRMKLKSKLIK